VLEVPTTCLLAKVTPPRTADPVIGGWASVRKLEHKGVNEQFHFAADQTTRLGNPLINELFIGLPDKDLWGATEPKNDVDFVDYIKNPTLPAIINLLFGVTEPRFPRNDLVAILMTGVPGINLPNVASPVIADILRLNTAVRPTPFAQQGSMAIFDFQLDGFPNGRRLGDDAVDIYLRAGMGRACTAAFRGAVCALRNAVIPGLNLGATCDALNAVCTTTAANFNEGHSNLHYTDRSPSSALAFEPAFPYLNIPIPGNLMGDCYRAEGVPRQFETRANCARGVVRRGCTAVSTDPSCNCNFQP